jgi:hypothetical protein
LLSAVYIIDLLDTPGIPKFEGLPLSQPRGKVAQKDKVGARRPTLVRKAQLLRRK